MTPLQSSPRHAAIASLNQFQPQQQNLKEVMQKFLAHTAERNVATDLIIGVVRNRLLIDHLLEKIAGVRINHVEKKLQNVLRVGVFEYVFTPDRAEYAIVDAAVEYTKSVGGHKRSGFVNAVLRNIGRAIAARTTELEKADPSKTVPVTLEMGCLFNEPVLPGTEREFEKYLSVAYSIPQWLVSGWIRAYGRNEAKLICAASNRRPSLYIRPNLLKTTSEKLLALFTEDKIECERIDGADMLRVINAGRVERLPGFENGLFVIQDLTAALAVKALEPQQGWKILDLCSAPGGKTTQMAELMNDKGTIIATDIDSLRLGRVSENQNRLGIKCIQTVAFDRIDTWYSENGPFDAVLLDVPCSNTGVLAKRPEVRYRIEPKAVKEIAKTQLELLAKAAKYVRIGGKICYSTCSIEEQENMGVVEQFLKNNNGFSVQDSMQTLPVASKTDCDGGFYAILERIG